MKFLSFSEIEIFPNNSLINCSGIIVHIGKIKQPKIKKLREIIIIDNNFKELTLTIWNDQFSFFLNVKKILYLFKVRLTEFSNVKKLVYDRETSFKLYDINTLSNFNILRNFLLLNNDLIIQKIKLLNKFNSKKPDKWSSLNILNSQTVLLINEFYFKIKASIISIGEFVQFKQCKKCLSMVKINFCTKCQKKQIYFKNSYLINLEIADNMSSYQVVIYDNVLSDFFNLPSMGLIKDAIKCLNFKSLIFEIVAKRYNGYYFKVFELKVLKMQKISSNYGYHLLDII